MSSTADSSSTKPRISLICVVLNVARYIESTIESVRAQTYPGWELIIIDGASTDGTQEVVERCAKIEPRIKFRSEPDEGPWDATDKGVTWSEGEFLMIIGGQDGFLDNEWFARCIKVFDEDKTVSLVWAPTRGMLDDGTLLPDDHVSYSHFMHGEDEKQIAQGLLKKSFKVASDLVTAPPARKKVLLKKIFSKTAFMRLNFFTRRNFENGMAPQKEDWFRYWLDTGIPFSDLPLCVSKKVYLACVGKYIHGSRVINDHMTDFFYNFNSKGYLSCYIPILAGYGRQHPGSSGQRIPEVLYQSDERYMRKIMALRKRLLGKHEEMKFVDRDGRAVSTRTY